MPRSIENCAEWIAEHRLAGQTLADIPSTLKPGDEDRGYAGQKHLRVLLSKAGWGPLAGWKVGVTTPGMRSHLGIDHAMLGAMHEHGRFVDGAKVTFGEFTRLGIECEIAMRLSQPLGDAGAKPVTVEEARLAVGELYPAIELVDDRYGGDYPAMGVPTIAADCCFHAGFVLGPAVAAWRGIDLGAAIGITSANGVEQMRGKGSDVMGNPFESLVWLANRLAQLGERIEAGQIVLTGSLPIPYWAKANEKIDISISGLGRAGIELH